MTTSPNVLIITPDLEFGGAERAVHYMGKSLADHYHVTECIFNSNNGIAFPTKNKLFNLDINAGTNLFSKFLAFYNRCKKVKKYKKDNKIEISISQLEGADYVNLLTKGPEITILCIQGSKWFDGEIKGLAGLIRKRFLLPYLYKKADKIVAVSKDIESELINYLKIPPSKITVIENACDIEMVIEKLKEPLPEHIDQVFKNNHTIVTTGRLANQKNQAALLDIFNIVKHDLPQVKLIIAGDGPLREKLFAKCKSLDLRYWYLPDREEAPIQWDVLFLGFQENPFKFIKNGSLFVLSSGWEGFPLAVIEALACELPVLSSDCPTGPKEILSDNTSLSQYPHFGKYGVLLPVPNEGENSNTKLWSETIKSLILNKNITDPLRANAKQRAEEFSLKKIHDRWITLIESLRKETKN
jgi:glycosyltransferase involved in cell wall biosynthesis